MNVRYAVFLAAMAAMLVWASLPAGAAEPNMSQNQAAIPGSAGILQNATLVGTPVLDTKNQRLGQIKNVVLDASTGRATFVVIEAKASAGGQAAMLVVPFQALRVSLNAAENRQSVVLDLRADQIGAAPQIQNNQWQLLQNAQFLQQARGFYQAQTYTAARPIDAPPSMPAAPPAQMMAAPMIQFVAPQPCWNRGDPGWTHEMEEFSQE
jgi:sporulation protein YlmC with PRC-barrel domain